MEIAIVGTRFVAIVQARVLQKQKLIMPVFAWPKKGRQPSHR